MSAGQVQGFLALAAHLQHEADVHCNWWEAELLTAAADEIRRLVAEAV